MKVIPEVVIPLIGGVQELAHQKAIVKRVADEVLGKAGLKKQHHMIGTMIEIPRAALTADLVATEAEFFSFVTKDLTRTCMGLSRDDFVKFSKDCEEGRIFKANPSAVLDQEAVGQLVDIAVKKGRSARTELEVSVCGVPRLVDFCYRVGMKYVSCPPSLAWKLRPEA